MNSSTLLPTEERDFALTIDCGVPAAYFELRWYAAYTCANHEKRVAEQLARQSVEHFLPLYQTLRRWKDRRKLLILPLFPGYVFARIALKDRLQVLEVPGVVRLVGFNGQPAALPEEEIAVLRRGLTKTSHAQPHPYLTTGCRVRITRGPFAGLEGIAVRRKKSLRAVLSIELIQRSVLVDVDAASLEIPVTRRA